MNWHEQNSGSGSVDRVSILIRGAYNVGKTSLCKAFVGALDEMVYSRSQRERGAVIIRPGIEATTYGVYSRRLNMKDIIPFFTSQQQKQHAVSSSPYHSSSNTHYVMVNLIDTAGFDTNISRLPDSMIRDVDAVMLLFSCDLKEDSLRSCHVAYNILEKSPQLSSSVIEEYQYQNQQQQQQEEEVSAEIIYERSNQSLFATSPQHPKFPIFKMVGTKGDLIVNNNSVNNNNKAPSDLNKIKDYWSTLRREDDLYSVSQYEKLIELENKIVKQNQFQLAKTEFTSAVNGGGVLKAFLSLVANILETRMTLQEEILTHRSSHLIEKRREIDPKTTTTHAQFKPPPSPQPVLSDLSLELKRVNKKTAATPCTYTNRRLNSYGTMTKNGRITLESAHATTNTSTNDDESEKKLNKEKDDNECC